MFFVFCFFLLVWGLRPLCGGAAGMTRTGLHSEEAGPRIVGAAIA